MMTIKKYNEMNSEERIKKSKQLLEKYTAMLRALNRYNAPIPLRSDDKKFIEEVFYHHPEAENKVKNLKDKVYFGFEIRNNKGRHTPQFVIFDNHGSKVSYTVEYI